MAYGKTLGQYSSAGVCDYKDQAPSCTPPTPPGALSCIDTRIREALDRARAVRNRASILADRIVGANPPMAVQTGKDNPEPGCAMRELNLSCELLIAALGDLHIELERLERL